MFEGFDARQIDTGEATIFARIGGSGPGVLLLHGFPETHLMWRDVAPRLTSDFTVVCADLRGYGRSSCPPSDPSHAAYSKRAMALDAVALMGSLGFERFSVAGHDRGGRVAYRLALDHAERIERLAVLDIVPTGVAWDRADGRLALAFWPWSLLAQAEPLPERIIEAAADAIVADAADAWGSSSAAFPADVRAAYVDALRDPPHAHAICEEYRAAATLDRDHDHADADAGRRITSRVLVLWSDNGGLETWYPDLGGPLGVWRGLADNVRGQAIQGGHFFPEELPELTADRLDVFFKGDD